MNYSIIINIGKITTLIANLKSDRSKIALKGALLLGWVLKFAIDPVKPFAGALFNAIAVRLNPDLPEASTERQAQHYWRILRQQ